MLIWCLLAPDANPRSTPYPLIMWSGESPDFFAAAARRFAAVGLASASALRLNSHTSRQYTFFMARRALLMAALLFFILLGLWLEVSAE